MSLHALVPQCSLSVLSYSECKIAKIFHWGGLTAPPDSPAAQRFFSSLRSLLDTALFMHRVLCITYQTHNLILRTNQIIDVRCNKRGDLVFFFKIFCCNLHYNKRLVPKFMNISV